MMVAMTDRRLMAVYTPWTLPVVDVNMDISYAGLDLDMGWYARL